MFKTHSAAAHRHGESWNTSDHSDRGLLPRIASVITLKRLGIGLAGTFAFAGIAAGVHMATGGQSGGKDATHDNLQHTQSSTTPNQHDSSDPGPDHAATSSPSGDNGSSSSGSSNSDNRTDVVLNIGGTQVAVPGNGSTHKVINNSDGSTTTVDSSSSNTKSGSDDNGSSHSSFDLKVNTESHSSGGG